MHLHLHALAETQLSPSPHAKRTAFWLLGFSISDIKSQITELDLAVYVIVVADKQIWQIFCYLPVGNTYKS